MRITNNMIISKMMTTMNVNLERMSKVQDQLATGKKINIPSDNPIVAARALKFRSDISEIDQFKKNAEDALSWTEITESTLGSIGDAIHRARELAVQAGSDTNSNEERQKIKAEVEQLFKQVVKLSNTTYAGRYIFSGYKTDQPLILEQDKNFTYTDIPVVTNAAATAPLPPNSFRLKNDNITALTNIKASIGGAPAAALTTIIGGPPTASGEVGVDMATGNLAFWPADVTAGLTNVTSSYTLNRTSGSYNPDAYSYLNTTQTVPMQGEDVRFEVGIGDKIEVNTIGTNVFGAVSGASNTAIHLESMSKFVNALNTNDTNGIQDALTNMDSFLDSVLASRADIGARTNRLELTSNRLSDDFANFTDLMSKNEDADIAEVIMKLKNEENVYKASMEVGARIIQPTLVDFIR